MAPGLYGADIEQLRSLSKSMDRSGSRLMDTERQITGLVAGIDWKGNDGGRFRREWSDTWRPMMRQTSQSLLDASKLLLTQADEQETRTPGHRPTPQRLEHRATRCPARSTPSLPWPPAPAGGVPTPR